MMLSIAPMIDWSYTHFRVFMRMLAPQALIYTEMQTIGAVQNNPERALLYTPFEHPLALQLGGSSPELLAACAVMAEQQGYDEVNLNLGCPSDRVQAGHFGACLMREPSKVVDCIRAMKDAVGIPVTAKTRIGIDHEDSYEYFRSFASALIEAGADKLVVHARKAWLHGLNPKQNRTIPPLHYDYVYQIKQEFPDVPVVINGNITTIDEINTHLEHVDGVMVGRLACDKPYEIAKIHNTLYPEHELKSRQDILMNYLNYAEPQFKAGVPLSVLLKPLFGLMSGIEGSSRWKQQLMHATKERDLSCLYDFGANFA